MRPKTCDECLWSGHQRCQFGRGGPALRTGPVPATCTDALRRIEARDVHKLVASKEGRKLLRKQVADNRICHPGVVGALLCLVDALESDLEDARGEIQEAYECDET